MSLLHLLHSGSVVAGHSLQHSQASLVLGLPVCCVEWFPAGVGQTNLLWITGVAVTERVMLSQSSLVWISRSSVCCRNDGFAGHVARSKSDSLASQNAHDSRSGMVAPCAGSTREIERQVERCSYNVWRWEAPLKSFYGRAFRESHAEATSEGWLLKAQDREAWKSDEWVFARAQ